MRGASIAILHYDTVMDDPAYAITTAGRGVLLRFLLGDTLTTLLADDQLVATIAGAVPGQVNGGAGS